MRKSTIGLGTGTALLVGFIMVLSSAAHAAGEWEWTAGQGWIRGAGVARPTPKEQLHYAYELEQKSEFMDAARQYFLLVQNFPSSEEAGVGLQRLARCLFEMENYYTSYKAIEQVIETYPNTGRMSDLVEIELQIAKRIMQSQTPDILSGRDDNIRHHNIGRGLEIIDSVIEHDPYGPVAAEAYLVKGEGNLLIGEINKARTAFETIRDEFPRSDFYERARLGILQCDSLVGQANPREVREQIEVVREAERERAERYKDAEEDFDEVEESIRQLSEVEAQKMMDQAEQYRRMGTRDGVKASEFLYKEIARRYPGTPQADDAMERMGNIRMPKEKSRIASAVRNIKLNPFAYNKNPEPPWIVPQLAAEDMVMVDSGVGPITGVPETGLPSTDYSATVRPASLPEEPKTEGRGNFSPITAAPGAGEGPERSDREQMAGAMPPPGFNPPGSEPAHRQPAPNPLSTVSESDLVVPGSNANRPAPSAGSNGYAVGYPQNGAYGDPMARQGGQARPGVNQYYDNTPILPGGMTPPPSLGAPEYHTPYSDLIGGVPAQQPYGGYSQQQGYQGYAPQEPVYQNQTYPRSSQDPNYGYNGYGYGQEPAYPANGNNYNNYGNNDYYNQVPSYDAYPAPSYGNDYNSGYSGSGNGGWTFGEDLR